MTYVVNPAGAPDGYRDLVADSVAAISAATGLRFDDEGTTDARPFAATGSPTFARSPVVIGWVTPEEEPRLEGDIAGVGAAWPWSAGPPPHLRDRRDRPRPRGVHPPRRAGRPRQRPRDPHARARPRAGLAHVNDPGELMFYDNTGQAALGPGDREGLARLGTVDAADRVRRPPPVTSGRTRS